MLFSIIVVVVVVVVDVFGFDVAVRLSANCRFSVSPCVLSGGAELASTGARWIGDEKRRLHGNCASNRARYPESTILSVKAPHGISTTKADAFR